MNLFGALEAVTHQHANDIADLIAANKGEFEHFNNTANTLFAAEATNVESRRAALKEQFDLLDNNEVENARARERLLKDLVTETHERYMKLDAALTQIRNNILSGDFKFKPREVERTPFIIEPDPADLELLPRSQSGGEREDSTVLARELSVNET